jgi:STAS-like domain of unknown function (DUF4325)
MGKKTRLYNFKAYMAEQVQISVVDIAGTPICVAVEDGHRVHNAIAEKLQVGVAVVVSFNGVTRLTTAFLNVAFGQHYNEFPEEVVARLVTASGMDGMTAKLLEKVIERAKHYYRDPARHEAAAKSIIDGDKH